MSEIETVMRQAASRLLDLPTCSAHTNCLRPAFLLLRDLPVCRHGYDEMGGIL